MLYCIVRQRERVCVRVRVCVREVRGRERQGIREWDSGEKDREQKRQAEMSGKEQREGHNCEEEVRERDRDRETERQIQRASKGYSREKDRQKRRRDKLLRGSEGNRERVRDRKLNRVKEERTGQLFFFFKVIFTFVFHEDGL